MNPNKTNIERILNSGSGGAFHNSMKSFALMKFGPNPNKTDKTSWAPTADRYANQLLDKFVGVTTAHYGNVAMRIFLKAVLANELGNYLLTGNVTEGLLSKFEYLDKYYWTKGAGYSEQTPKLEWK